MAVDQVMATAIGADSPQGDIDLFVSEVDIARSIRINFPKGIPTESLLVAATKIASLACEVRGSDERLAVALLANLIPSSSPALPNIVDCLARNTVTEDASIWRALELWRGNDWPRTHELRLLAERVRDERTKERLMTWRELVSAPQQPEDRVNPGPVFGANEMAGAR